MTHNLEPIASSSFEAHDDTRPDPTERDWTKPDGFVQSLLDKSQAMVCFYEPATNTFLMNENLARRFEVSKSSTLESFLARCRQIEVVPREQFEAFFRSICSSEPVSTLECSFDTHLFQVVPYFINNPDSVFLTWYDHTETLESSLRKEVFLAELSHEIRTPLTAIKGFTELLLHQPLTREKQANMLRLIQQETERLERLADHYLDFQRHDAVVLNGHMDDVSVSHMLDEILATFHATTATHTISIQIEPENMTIVAHADRVRQCLQNLIHNAIKYSPQGGNVSISAFEEAHEIVIQIRDEGIGIPADALPKLFERYYRVESEAHRAIKGTGLGLQICKQCMDAHGGSIHVESVAGIGSTFTLRFPQRR